MCSLLCCYPLLLPVVVAGIVIIVQLSLALAFSRAVTVAAVRFRLTLDDSLDARFIFLSIGAGLAVGILALEIAGGIPDFFNDMMLFFGSWTMQMKFLSVAGFQKLGCITAL